ncbi:hypothetical protein VP01_5415g2 [Puccinia sorghi]|uniref:Uncharacterized protein n=1 Tax=Puccinia sorghi TaxID=27349 RepID=A0A0L6UJS1_9BASI|nr:hypothetical protein VP01_5415g2 [Puccinia sorghi]
MSNEGLINAEIKQLKDFRTLWKLHSVLAHKISGPNTSEPFFLMSELDVEHLQELFFQIREVELNLQAFATDVSNLYERRRFKNFSPESSPLFWNSALCSHIYSYSLAHYNLCSSPKPLSRSYEWCHMWQNLHKTALQNFSETHKLTRPRSPLLPQNYQSCTK